MTPACLTAAASYFHERGFHGTVEERSGANFTRYDPPATHKEEASRVLFATATIYGVANSQAAADTLVGLSVGAASGKRARGPSFSGALPAADAADSAQVRFFARPFDLWALLRSEAEHSESKAAATKTTKPAEDEPVEDELAAAPAWA